MANFFIGLGVGIVLTIICEIGIILYSVVKQGRK